MYRAITFTLSALILTYAFLAEARKGQNQAVPQQRPPQQQATTPKPAPVAQPAAPKVVPLNQWVDAAIESASKPRLRPDMSGMWAVSHGVLALGTKFKMLPLPEFNLPTLNGFQWFTMSGKWKGLTAFEATTAGARGRPYDGEPGGFEGHPDQFLAYLTGANLPLTHQIYAKTRYATIQDLVNHAKANANIPPTQGYAYEPLYTLWGLAHYLPADATWTNANREPWSIERLVEWVNKEVENLDGTTVCGGTHHLEGLVVALQKWALLAKPDRAPWSVAKMLVGRNIEAARVNQNPDGSFSTKFFINGGFSNDYKSRLPGNGHTLEFLMMALTDGRLNEDWVRRGVLSVAMDLYNNRGEALVGTDAGPFYHALHGLILYKERTFGKPTKATSVPGDIPIVAAPATP